MEADNSNELGQFFFFPSAIYRSSQPKFLPATKLVLEEHLGMFPTHDEIYPINQTGMMFDIRIKDLIDYVGQSSWGILQEQGFNMSMWNCTILDFWGQRFFKHGQHIEHTHNRGAQVSGFYFVEVPENSSRPIIFDPRPAKRQINLDERDMGMVSYASQQINFEVKAGDFLLMNSWLGHGFTPNASDKEFRFIHFNVGVIFNEEFAKQQECQIPPPPVPPSVEVI